MARIIRLSFPDGSYHTVEVSKFVSSSNGEKEILSIWYKDLDEIERTGEETGFFTLLRKNSNNTYTHLFCGDDYDAIYEELYDNIKKGKYVDISLNDLPLKIDSAEEFDYFSKKVPEKEEEVEDSTSNVIKINKLDDYIIYKYKKTIDVGDFLALSFENITNRYMNLDDDDLKEVECVDEYMFFELKNSENVFVKQERVISYLECMEYAINKKMTLITSHNIFPTE